MARDPKRIDKVCNAVRAAWSFYPDLRFAQLMSNALLAYQEQTDKDPYYLEDDDFIEFLMEFVSEV